MKKNHFLKIKPKQPVKQELFACGAKRFQILLLLWTIFLKQIETARCVKFNQETWTLLSDDGARQISVFKLKKRWHISLQKQCIFKQSNRYAKGKERKKETES